MLELRTLKPSDLSDVLAIENDTFEFPWTYNDFKQVLHNKPGEANWGLVYEINGEIAGYAIIAIGSSKLHLLNLAVARQYRRQQIGTKIVQRLMAKLQPTRKTRIVLEVRETNLLAQQFFRSMGFRAVNVFHDFYDDTTEDAYLMVYKVEAPQPRELVNEHHARC